MKRYDKYKESGISWIGEIPEHWEDSSFGCYFTFGKGLSITKRDLQEEGIAVISYGQIHSRQNTGTSIKEELVRKVATDYLRTSSQSLLNLHDIVFADTSEDLEGAGNNAYNDYIEPLFAGYHTIIARPKGLPFPKYFAYLFQSRDWRKSVQSLVNGIKVYSITKTILKKSFLLLPPLSEQEAIVAYLEEKVAQMDNLVAKQKAQIAYLRELKQAIIAKAVTQGIDPQAPLCPSGIPWIGNTPEHWVVRKIKYIFTERSEKGYPNEPILCSTQKYGVIPQSIYENRVVEVNKGHEGLKLVKEGNFVISLRSFQGGIEYAYYRGIISAAYTVLELNNDYNSEYMKQLLKSFHFVQLLQTCVTGIREGQNINYALLRKNFLPLPPPSEQEAIVTYINRKTEEIDRLIAMTEQEIARVRELKQTVIADVVTGRINVQPS